MPSTRPIAGHALISNCQGSALVALDGTELMLVDEHAVSTDLVVGDLGLHLLEQRGQRLAHGIVGADLDRDADLVG